MMEYEEPVKHLGMYVGILLGSAVAGYVLEKASKSHSGNYFPPKFAGVLGIVSWVIWNEITELDPMSGVSTSLGLYAGAKIAERV